jgi:hypothetical protein
MIININKSETLNRFVAGIHAGGLLIALALPAAPMLRLGLAAVVLASLFWQRRFGCLGAPYDLELRADGTCSTRSICGRQNFQGRILDANVHPGFVRFTVKPSGRRSRVLLLMRDAVERDDYRKLRAGILQGNLPPHDQAAA